MPPISDLGIVVFLFVRPWQDIHGNTIPDLVQSPALAPRFVGNIMPMTTAQELLHNTMNALNVLNATPFVVASTIPPWLYPFLNSSTSQSEKDRK